MRAARSRVVSGRCSWRMPLLAQLVVLAAALFVMAPPGARAAVKQVSLQWGSVSAFTTEGYRGVEEAEITSAYPDANTGGNWDLYLGSRPDGTVSRVLMRWDLSPLAALFNTPGTRVLMVELKLGEWYTHGVPNQEFTVHALTPANAGWVVGTVGPYTWKESQPGSVAWNGARLGEQAWAGAPGCGQPGVDYVAEPVARFRSDSDTRGMRPRYLPPFRLPVALAREWALHPEQNAGLLMKAVVEEGDRGIYVIGSEHQRADYGWDRHHPELTVTYYEPDEAPPPPPGRLVVAGRSAYTIVLPADATPGERYAAQELASHLEQITGAALPILPEDAYQRDMGPAVSIGRTRLSEKALSARELAKLGDEGYRLCRQGVDLILVGGRRRGALYGVYELLETLGVRWLTPQVTLLPKRASLGLPARARTVTPRFRYRDQLWNNNATPEWLARMRVNGEYARLPEARGGSARVALGCHSLDYLIPAELFDKHPEWFAVKEDGKRHRCPEYCLTNEGLRAYVLAKVREELRADPGIEYYWVSQNDGSLSGCFCEACTAERQRHGGGRPTGRTDQATIDSPGAGAGDPRWSANTISFVNAIARGIRDEFPRVRLKTLAYSYTVTPPENLRVEDNVTVVLCGNYGCCTFHPRGKGSLRQLLRRWTAISTEVQTYFYGGSNYGFWWPYPNVPALAENYQLADRDGVTAVYTQGTAPGYGAGLVDLRAYLSARIAWDPKRDIGREIHEFCAGYYGPGGPFIEQYVREYSDRVTRRRRCGGISWGNAEGWRDWVDAETISWAEALFQQALAATRDQPEYHRRVRAASLEVLWARVMLSAAPKPELRAEEYVLLPGSAGAEVREAAARFTEIMAEAGYDRMSEVVSYQPTENAITAMGRRHPVQRLRGEAGQVAVVPSLGGRIVSWETRAFGGNLLRLGGSGEPYSGGYEEASQFDLASPGAAADFQVVASTAEQLVLRAMLTNGVEVTRTLELAAEGTELRIRSEYRNAGKEPVRVTPRTHPEFAFSQLGEARLYVAGPDGGWQEHELASASTPTAEWRLPVATAARPEWLLGDPKRNLGLLNVFAPDAVETLYAFWGQEYGCVNLELWGKPVELAPGAACVLAHRYQVITDLRAFLAGR